MKLAEFDPSAPVTTAAPTALQTALEALRLAKENQDNYNKLTQKMTRATKAHAQALVFGNPMGTTPIPTLAPRAAAAMKAAGIPHTLGRLIYDAFVNTPQPLEMTTPMPTPMAPMAPTVAIAPLVPR